MRTRAVILHVDLDAFFSAVEQLHKPSLRDKPVVVGGIGQRGVVATASYEARAFGVGSAMPIAQARRLCPNAAYLAPRFGAYRAASVVVMELLRDLTPLVEQVSIDEAYLDLSPSVPEAEVEEVVELARRTRERLRGVTGLTASIGAGTSKLIAKMGSELAKPDGLLVIPPGEEASTLAPLPIGRLPWVGPATADVLRRRRITTIGDLAAMDRDEVVALLGRAHGTTLHDYARGIDPRPIVTEREAKSLSAEQTFPTDLTDPRELDQHLRQLFDRAHARLTDKSLRARTVTIKVRRYDFSTLTRSTTLDRPTDDSAPLLAAARRLLGGIDASDGLRLLGVGVSGFSDGAQLDLLDDLVGADLAGAGHAAPTDADRADEHDDVAGEPSVAPHPPGGSPRWMPGADVEHATHGVGWVQGSGVGRVTVRFEGPHTGRGRILTLDVDDPDLRPAPPPIW